MILSLQEILELDIVANEYAIHYIKDGAIVASIYKSTANLKINAHIGDDDHVIKFSFFHNGPIAIIYSEPIKTPDRGKDLPLEPTLSVVAIMSVIAFADVSLFDELNPKIIPTEVGQFDIGDPELFELAKQLICHHTKKEWEEDFLTKQYRAQ